MNETTVKDQVALIMGAGPGLGLALARCFLTAGMHVGMAARNGEKLTSLLQECSGSTGQVRAYTCDSTNEDSVINVFGRLQTDLGTPDLVVYNVGIYLPGEVVNITTADFEHCWRVGCLGGFLCGREAARIMLKAGNGTILFSGATASLRGGAGFANLAVGKFGLRALSQSMARELGPRGIHVAHVVIDGQILSPRYAGLASSRPADGLLSPDAIAASYIALHKQHRSAWSQELDLRPWVEKF